MFTGLWRGILAALTVGVLLLAACSTTPTSPPTGATAVGEAKPYGSLVIAGQFGTGPLDPMLGAASTYWGVGEAIFDPLLYRDAKDQLVGGIAEQWEIAPDGLTHTFYIRKGVRFHDGSDLTAADVKFSIERMLLPESVGSADVPEWRAALQSVEQKDAYTVALRLKVPRFELFNGVDSNMGAVLPKKYVEERGVDYFRKNPIGSGPWKFVSYDVGNKLVMEAVDNHWRAVPKFQSVTVLSVKEEGSRVAMLKTGELDLAPVETDSLGSLGGVR